MNPRPAPTTALASALLVASATLPLNEVFDGGSWAISVVGAALAASLVAFLIETFRPRVRLPALTLFTAVSAGLWSLLVARRDIFWESPTAADTWRELGEGVLDGWGALLDEQSPLTDPRGAETFVAFLVWIAAAVAVHVAARGRTALAAVLAGSAVLGVGTAAALPRGLPSASAGVAVGAMALFTIATITRAPDQRWRVSRMVALTSVVLGASVIAAIGGTGATSIDRAPLDPRASRDVETRRIEVPDVLSEFGVRREQDRSVMTIESAAPPAGIRLRLQIYEEHTGERWLPTAGFQEIASFPAPEELPPGELVTLTIDLDDLEGPWIPVPDRVISIDVPDIRWNDDVQVAIAEEVPTSYTVTGTVLNRTELDGLDGARDEVSDIAVEIPAGLPPEIQEVAEEVTADSDDAISAIDAITSHLRRFGRNESVPPGNSFARLANDLQNEMATGAEQIASLHALMLRSVGIPSRVVVGYLVNGAVVDAEDLHVWVEAAFPGIGWVAFNPVPAVTESGNDADDATAPPPTTTPGQAALEARALPRELGPGEDPDDAQIGVDEPFTTTDLLILVAFGLAAALAAMIMVRVIRRRVRLKLGWRPEVRILGAWAEMVDRLRELGAPITDTTTTGDVVYMADSMDEELGSHTRVLAGLAAVSLHGPTAPTPDDATLAYEELRRAEARLTVVRGRISVPRRFLDPRVLRYRAPKPPDERDGGRRTELR